MSTTNAGTAEALVAAWQAAGFEGLPPPIDPVALTRTGWTVPLFEHVVALADRAIAVDSGTAQRAGAAMRGVTARFTEDPRTTDVATRTFRRYRRFTTSQLLRAAVDMADNGGLPLPEALTWLAVFAVRADLSALACVKELLPATWARGSGNRDRSLLDQWRAARVPGCLAPLAYAAGLSPVEAQEQQHAGTLTAASLMLLAGLQGYRLVD